MNKTAIKNFAVSARRKLIAMAADKAGRIGITATTIAEPSSSGSQFAIFPTGFGTQTRLDGDAVGQRASLVSHVKSDGYDTVMEEVAYTWFNRMIAVRFMEVNDYLPTRVRVLSSETPGKFEPDLVTQAPNVDLGFSEAEKEEIYALKDDPEKSGDLFRTLFIRQCNALGAILPELFEKTADYTELLLDLSWDKPDGVIRDLLSIDEADFREAVEIVGWMYQYYILERKDEVINIYKGVIEENDIPAATQLFTTDWVVRYMVDNSLGRYWIERNPNSKLKEKLAFFVAPKNGEIKTVSEKIDPTELTFFDPCMGSGHILVYAFDVLMEVYRECGYTDADAVECILTHNLYGTDLDLRAYQLAYFAVMMRAKKYSRKALEKGLRPNIHLLLKSQECHIENKDLQYLINEFNGAQQYGALIELRSDLNLDRLQEEIDNITGQLSFDSDYVETANRVIQVARVLTRHYCAVCTNPPYLNKMNPFLKNYVNEHYKDYSGDLFSVFIYHNFSFCKQDGYAAFMSPFVWMFIKTYEKLRDYIITNKSITSLIQMEYSAFEEATVPICSFVLKNGKSAEKGLYFKLSDFKGGMEVQKQKVLEAIADKDCDYFYETDAENFKKIPGAPIAYWVSEKVLNTFENPTMGDLAKPRQGMATTNNNLFLRLWFEINNTDLFLCAENKNDALSSGKKWFPYNKGGEFRKWFGNNDFVVDWHNDGEAIKKYLIGKNPNIPRSESLYFKKCFSWSLISSGNAAFRFKPQGHIFDIAGMSCFSKELLCYLLGLANTPIVLKFLQVLAPTINFQAGDIANIPVIVSNQQKPHIDELVEENIQISKTDWDSFETSWDFEKHPLIRESTVRMAFAAWEQECTDRFDTLKANEEELNRIFIDIYGLQDELTPEVADKDVTVRLADKTGDIKSLISYAVGCMFGRYSLDAAGLAYAGGDWDASKYTGFLPDRDNVLPITDEAYFPDDIVTRFVSFVKTVYGGETLEENLDFIAQALGNKGDSSRQVIRNYFLKDFYKDHCKIYQKRPIYWLFDSGKEDGFKALIYLHRYNPDTVGLVRADYLHKQQGFLENAIANCDYTLEKSKNARDKADAAKKRDKLIRQRKETNLYDQALAHIALRRIDLDLDDGVKVNYEKFQGVEVAREGQKTQTIDLLGKI